MLHPTEARTEVALPWGPPEIVQAAGAGRA